MGMPADEEGGRERPVAVYAALPEEIAPLLRRLSFPRRLPGFARAWSGRLAGRAVILVATGAGSVAARAGAGQARDRFSPCLWLGMGFAGALSAELPAGSIVVGDEIVDETGGPVARLDAEAAARVEAAVSEAARARFVRVTRIVTTAAEKAALLGALSRGRPAVVDMESGGWAEGAAGAAGVIIRAVSDDASEGIPDFVSAATSPSGAIDRAAIARHALRHPSSIGKLLALRRRAALCADRLADVVERFASQGF